jgi:hypothetical protein
MSKSGSHSHPGGERPRAYEKLAAAVSKLNVTAPPRPTEHTQHADHGTLATSVRTAQHQGHTLEVTTTYRFTVDGQQVIGHFSVDNAGKVHCHDLPNYAFSSALELGKRLVELMPRGEPIADELNGPQPEHDDHDADHTHGGR